MRDAYRYFLFVAILWTADTVGFSTVRADETSADDEPIEMVDDVQVADVSDASAPASLFALQIIGRNHAAAVHLPIGLLFAICLAAVAQLILKKEALGGCAYLFEAAAALSFVPAALSGMLRAQELFGGGDPAEPFFEHRNLMILSLAVLLAALGLRIARKNRLTGKLAWVHLGLIFAAFFIAAVGAHHGGMLVYGESFLPY